MTSLEILNWVHLLGAAVWTGGLITLAVIVVTLRRAGAGREILQAVAHQFGRVSWIAFGLLVVTGIWQVHQMGLSWANKRLTLKLTLVILTAGASAIHQFTARTMSPAFRGIIQGVILLLSVAVFGTAVWLV